MVRFVQDELKNMSYYCVDFGSYSKSNGHASAPVAPRFAECSYWDGRYQEGGEAFEWIFSTALALPFVESFVAKSSKALVIGCGNSRLTEDMYQKGWKDLTSIDYSPAVIRQQTKRSIEKRLKCRWMVMDVRRLRFPSCSFGAVIDKGTADNLLCYEHAERNLGRMLREIYRCLEPGGMYLIFSLNDPEDILEHAVNHPKFQWVVSQTQIRNEHGKLQTVLAFKKLEGLLSHPLRTEQFAISQQRSLSVVALQGKSVPLLRMRANVMRQLVRKTIDRVESGSPLLLGERVESPMGIARVVQLPEGLSAGRGVAEGAAAGAKAWDVGSLLMYRVELASEAGGYANMQRRLLRRAPGPNAQ